MNESDLIYFYEIFSALEYYGNATGVFNVINETEYSDTLITSNGNNQNSIDTDVFISYSRKDTEQIKSIINLLNEMKIKYWIDVNDAYSGDNYKSTIYDAILHTKIVLFISSENSNKSLNVEKEISIADEQKKIIIPIKIDTSTYSRSISYDISSIDAIDYSERKVETLKKIKNSILAKIAIHYVTEKSKLQN